MILNKFPHPLPSLSSSQSAPSFSPSFPLHLAAKFPVTAADGVFSLLGTKLLHPLRLGRPSWGVSSLNEVAVRAEPGLQTFSGAF